MTLPHITLLTILTSFSFVAGSQYSNDMMRAIEHCEGVYSVHFYEEPFIDNLTRRPKGWAVLCKGEER